MVEQWNETKEKSFFPMSRTVYLLLFEQLHCTTTLLERVFSIHRKTEETTLVIALFFWLIYIRNNNVQCSYSNKMHKKREIGSMSKIYQFPSLSMLIEFFNCKNFG